MKRFLTRVACAAALCSAGIAQAALLTFNNPGQIDIDSNTGVATYTEAGYQIVGAAASFLPISDPGLGDVMVGGFDTTPFSLFSASGGNFALQSFDYAFFDLGFGPGNLSVVGLLNGAQVISTLVDLRQSGSLFFDAASAWNNVSEVRFMADSGFALDNISAVPEPGTLALSAGALFVMGAGMGAARRRRSA